MGKLAQWGAVAGLGQGIISNAEQTAKDNSDAVRYDKEQRLQEYRLAADQQMNQDRIAQGDRDMAARSADVGVEQAGESDRSAARIQSERDIATGHDASAERIAGIRTEDKDGKGHGTPDSPYRTNIATFNEYGGKTEEVPVIQDNVTGTWQPFGNTYIPFKYDLKDVIPPPPPSVKTPEDRDNYYNEKLPQVRRGLSNDLNLLMSKYGQPDYNGALSAFQRHYGFTPREHMVNEYMRQNPPKPKTP